jgi:hypothetical protein
VLSPTPESRNLLAAVSSLRPPLRSLLPWFLFWVGLTLFFATQAGWIAVFTDRRAPPFGLNFFLHAAHWLTWGLLSLGIVALARRYPISGHLRLRHGALHLAVALALSPLQLVVMQSIVHIGRSAAGQSPDFVRDFRRELGEFFHVNLLTYGVVLAVATALDSRRRAGEQQILAARLAEQLAAARLAALQMQVHPHFLFNSLHTAAELVHENPSLAERTLLRLADLLRRSLRESAREEVTLADHLELVDCYIELESVRLEGRLRVRYDVPDELLGATMPALLLQPLVENAVRHGVARRGEGGEIVVSARRTESGFEVEIANDLPGSDAPARHAGTGIGLANVRARLAHRFGDRASLVTDDTSGRFVARLSLPLSHLVEPPVQAGGPPGAPPAEAVP